MRGISEEWQKKILARVQDSEKRDPHHFKKESNWGVRLSVLLTPEFLKLLHAAAKTRNICLSGYVRRALTIQMAMDMDMDVYEILEKCPFPAAYGRRHAPADMYRKTGPRSRTTLADNGESYGEWPWT